MGYISFASRKDNNKEIGFDMLADPDDEGDLASFSIGDRIALQLYTPIDLGERIGNLQPLAGVKIDIENPVEREGKPQRHAVDIAATVIAKTHAICPDWMTGDHGLRVSDHTIIVQCASDEGQDVLLWIRSNQEPSWAKEEV